MTAKHNPFGHVDDDTLAFCASLAQAMADTAQKAAARRPRGDTAAAMTKRKGEAAKLQSRAAALRKELKRRKKERKV